MSVHDSEEVAMCGCFMGFSDKLPIGLFIPIDPWPKLSSQAEMFILLPKPTKLK